MASPLTVGLLLSDLWRWASPFTGKETEFSLDHIIILVINILLIILFKQPSLLLLALEYLLHLFGLILQEPCLFLLVELFPGQYPPPGLIRLMRTALRLVQVVFVHGSWCFWALFLEVAAGNPIFGHLSHQLHVLWPFLLAKLYQLLRLMLSLLFHRGLFEDGLLQLATLALIHLGSEVLSDVLGELFQLVDLYLAARNWIVALWFPLQNLPVKGSNVRSLVMNSGLVNLFLPQANVLLLPSELFNLLLMLLYLVYIDRPVKVSYLRKLSLSFFQADHLFLFVLILHLLEQLFLWN